MSEQLKALILDLDDTLTFTQHLHFLAFQKIFQERFQITYSAEEDKNECAGAGSKFIFPYILKKNGFPEPTDGQVKELENAKKKVYEELLHTTDIRTVPGVKKFLQRMEDLGVKMIIASGNKLEFIDLILSKVNIRKHFRHPHITRTHPDVKKLKPHPDVFLAAIKELGCTPEEVIAIGDAQNDVRAAVSANIPNIVIAALSAKETMTQLGAQIVVEDFDQLTPEVLDKILTEFHKMRKEKKDTSFM